ncbi:MAG TPA: 1-acyl-sn-glycerol-3-phosphate acyltransferase [Rhodospirillaceae bacterium]|nr:1-acyl-sn-glycerol-3-phosphate acyltransferase [Rhodospirillaceae bacterium]
MKTEITSGLDVQIKGAFRLSGFLLLILIFFPIQGALGLMGKEKTLSSSRVFCFILTKILGFRVVVHGDISPHRPTLFASNHSSYLDIPVLGSLIRGHFVAKADVASWPVIGLMARMQKTIFVERRASRAKSQQEILRESLEEEKNIILFPEGTSSDGHRTLPFKSSLFGIVEKKLDNGSEIFIQPVSIVCTQIGGLPMGRLWRPYYAWYGDMTFAKHLWDAFKIGSFTVEVVFHPVVTIESFGDRKKLADYCQKATAGGVNGSVTGRALEANA